MSEIRTVTLADMLGDELADWVITTHEHGTLTTKKLRAKLHEHRDALLRRGIDADYAYYAVIYAMQQLGQPIRED